MNRNNARLHCTDAGINRKNESLHRMDARMNRNNARLHSTNARINRDKTGLHRTNANEHRNKADLFPALFDKRGGDAKVWRNDEAMKRYQSGHNSIFSNYETEKNYRCSYREPKG